MRKLGPLLLGPTWRAVLQVPRALVVSALAAAADVILLVLLVERLGWRPATAATASYLLGGGLQYWLSSVWVFPAAPSRPVLGFAAFTLLSLGGLGITWLVVRLMHDGAGVHYAVAKCVALGLAFCWNFSSRRYLLFRAPVCPKDTEEHVIRDDAQEIENRCDHRRRACGPDRRL